MNIIFAILAKDEIILQILRGLILLKGGVFVTFSIVFSPDIKIRNFLIMPKHENEDYEPKEKYLISSFHCLPLF